MNDIKISPWSGLGWRSRDPTTFQAALKQGWSQEQDQAVSELERPEGEKMKVVIRYDDSAQSSIELSERYSGPASTRWLHRHPRLYWASLYRSDDRFAQFLRPYVLEPSLTIKSISIELSAGKESRIFSDLAQEVVGYYDISASIWTESASVSIINFTSDGARRTCPSASRFSDLVRAHRLDLIELACEQRLYRHQEAVATAKREPISMKLIYASTSSYVYELTPCRASLYFVALVLLSQMTSANFVIDILRNNHVYCREDEDTNASRWLYAATSAANLASMGYMAKQVAHLFVPACREVIDKIGESKNLAECKAGGEARMLLENMAAAMLAMSYADSFDLGCCLAADSERYLNDFLHDLDPSEREKVQERLPSIAPRETIPYSNKKVVTE